MFFKKEDSRQTLRKPPKIRPRRSPQVFPRSSREAERHDPRKKKPPAGGVKVSGRRFSHQQKQEPPDRLRPERSSAAAGATADDDVTSFRDASRAPIGARRRHPPPHTHTPVGVACPTPIHFQRGKVGAFSAPTPLVCRVNHDSPC